MSFIIKPIDANLYEEMDYLKKSDPYCIIFIGNSQFRSKTHSNGGKTPTWNDDVFIYDTLKQGSAL